MSWETPALLFATLVSIFTLVKEFFLDRARLRVRMHLGGDFYRMRPDSQHGIAVSITNLGRQPATVEAVHLSNAPGFSTAVGMEQTPFIVGARQTKVVVLPASVDDLFDTSKRIRFPYVVDGVSHIHPFRRRVQVWWEERRAKRFLDRLSEDELSEATLGEEHEERSEG